MSDKFFAGSDEPKWPVLAEGGREKPVFLETGSGFELDLEMTVSLLRAYGIPVLVKYPGDGGFGKVILGFSGSGADLYVPESKLEEAKEILSADPKFSEEDGDDFV